MAVLISLSDVLDPKEEARPTIAEKSKEVTQSPERLDSKQKRHRDLFASRYEALLFKSAVFEVMIPIRK